MKKFLVIVILRNGKELSGIYETISKRRIKVAEELLDYNSKEKISLISEDGTERIFFDAKDISALKVKYYHPNE